MARTEVVNGEEVAMSPEAEAAFLAEIAAGLGDSKDALRTYAYDKRAAVERGGYAWNGHIIMTDAESQQKLATERLAVITGDRIDGEIWFTADGPVPLTNDEISGVATSVRAWVKSLYAIRVDVLARIESGDITTTDEIDTAFQA